MKGPIDTSHTSPIDWEFIIETIREEKCILFLGPELFTNNEGVRLEDRLIDFLNIEQNPDIQAYYQEDNLFLFTSRGRKTKTFYKIKNFFNGEFPEAKMLFEKIALIPFHFIIQVTPDSQLSQVFKDLQVKHNNYFYWKKKAPDPQFQTPTKTRPVIYNMLGSVERQESMVLTHTDLFNYFESIFSGSSMPEKFKKLVKEANNFIFLGIHFERWYMQLLLRILYIHNDFDFVRYASNQIMAEEVKAFCFDQFKIEFVPKKIKEFVDEIYQRCEKANLLRQFDQEKESSIDRFLNWLAEDQIEKVLSGFKQFLEELGQAGQELKDDAILLRNKFNRLKKRSLQGIISADEASLQSNRIRRELLDLLNEAKLID